MCLDLDKKKIFFCNFYNLFYFLIVNFIRVIFNHKSKVIHSENVSEGLVSIFQ